MYKLTISNTLVRLSDSASIPNDPNNTDYTNYLKWVSEGNTPTPVTMSEVRANNLQALAVARGNALRNQADILIGANSYPATQEYREQFSAMRRKQAAGEPLPNTIRNTAGTAVQFTPAILAQLVMAVDTHVTSTWDKYWLRHDAVQSATTIAAVNAVVW